MSSFKSEDHACKNAWRQSAMYSYSMTSLINWVAEGKPFKYWGLKKLGD